MSPAPTVLKQRKDRLEKIDGPLSGSSDVTTFDYDACGRVRTVTDSEGYATATDYDDLNRVTRVTYPDTSYEQVLYDKLDAEWTRDRLGRWSRTFHNALRQVVAVQNPQGLITQFEWCLCGALQKLWDPAGHLTHWVRDSVSSGSDQGDAVAFTFAHLPVFLELGSHWTG